MFGHDSKANMSAKDGTMKEISPPKSEVLILEGLPTLLCFAPLGYYFVFPALISLMVKECPCNKIMRLINDDWKDRYVHAEREKSLLPRDYILGSSRQNVEVNNDENILWDYPGTKPDDLGF